MASSKRGKELARMRAQRQQARRAAEAVRTRRRRVVLAGVAAAVVLVVILVLVLSQVLGGSDQDAPEVQASGWEIFVQPR